MFVFMFCFFLVISPANVKGLSMQPTLNDKDHLFIEKISKLTNTLQRGNIVVFDSAPVGGHGHYVKRLIGLAGDTIEIKNKNVYVNDKLLTEPYLPYNTPTEPTMKITVPKDKVFVLGDNRQVSGDSRYFGCVPQSAITGHAIFRFSFSNTIK